MLRTEKMNILAEPCQHLIPLGTLFIDDHLLPVSWFKNYFANEWVNLRKSDSICLSKK